MNGRLIVITSTVECSVPLSRLLPAAVPSLNTNRFPNVSMMIFFHEMELEEEYFAPSQGN